MGMQDKESIMQIEQSVTRDNRSPSLVLASFWIQNN